MRSHLRRTVLALVLAATACRPSAPERTGAATVDSGPRRLPTGRHLDPAGTVVDVGPMPLGMVPTPEGDRVVLLLGGWRQQGVQIVDRATGAVVQTLDQPAAFVGVAFAPDGRTLYASGGNGDVVYRYRWADRAATLVDSLVLATKRAVRDAGTRYPAGLALSPDGRRLYVAENLADSLAVVDLESGRVVQRHATERYPYAVAVAPDGTVYVSAWGGNTVSVFAPNDVGLQPVARLAVARHPSALLLNAAGTRLFVASGSTDRVVVVDTRARRAIATLNDAPPSGPAEGSTPNALALSRDGARLYVAEADANAVAAFDLAAATADVAGITGTDRLAGRVPTGWYPTAVVAFGDTLVVANGKGRGSAPNVDGPQPTLSREHQGSPANTTLRQIGGSLQIVGLPRDASALGTYSARVAAANGWDRPGATSRAGAYPPFEHVIYVIKENRTYDQLFGDLTQADGDTSLLYFSRAQSPNHHALAERFGIYDRFFVNAEVSPDGHNWSMGAYATDYLEKTVPSNYSARGRTYDYEGTNRGRVPDDDAAEPASGYLWNLAERKGITFRNYGEFVVPEDADRTAPMPRGYRGNKPFLAQHTHPTYPGFDLTIPDQHRADLWIAELQEFVRQGKMPALEIVRLPNDHTSGARRGSPTPRAFMADNDLALGRMIEALSRTPFWRNTVVFVLEDDAQNGPDHVDSHRSPLLVISPWARTSVHHQWANTTDVLRTIEEILGLASLSQFDHYGRPLRDVWTTKPDLRPYAALTPSTPLGEVNTAAGPDARASAHLALDFEDQADEDTFNRILWRAAKGPNAPYPGTRRLTGLELKTRGF